MTNITTQMVSFEVRGRTAQAHLALPGGGSSGGSSGAGVVVIQEWWGLEDHIKDVANRFAAEGFVALAPDLYYGQVATEPDEARKLAMSLRQELDQALAAIQASIDFLLAHERVSSKTIGVTGFCMGGGLTWHGAAKLKGIGAAVPFYGGGSELSDEEVAQISVPVLAIFGELDAGVSPEVAQARAAQMDKAGVSHETIVYPQAQHAFFNDTRLAYHPEAAADSWQRMLKLFRETL